MADNSKIDSLIKKDDIKRVLIRYAEACDRRAWLLYNDVFDEHVVVNYGGAFQLSGRDQVVDMIKSLLGGCGPTQHLLGNFRIEINRDTAMSICAVRAVHSGTGNKKNVIYEVWAEYKDTLTLMPSGWRIVAREMIVYKEVGSREILGPEKKI